MTTMPRDLERALIRAGVPEDEARAVADGFDQLATKGDLEVLRLATKGDLDALRSEFETFQERILELLEQHRAATDRRHDDLRADLNQRMDEFRAEFIRALGQHQESTDKRFDDMNARLEELNRTMWRIFIWMGGVITGLLGVLVYQVFS